MNPSHLPPSIAMDRDALDRQFDQLRMSALFGDGQAVALQSQPDLGTGPIITDLDDGLEEDGLTDEIFRDDRRAGLPEAEFTLKGCPLDVSFSRPQELTRDRRSVAPVRHMTALLVDDEPTERRLCRRMLEHAGYEVLEAADMPEARAAIAQRGPVDVMISDVRKAMDGEWSL